MKKSANKLSDALRELRVTVGTLAEMGELLGADRITVHRWEVGKAMPKPAMLAQLATLSLSSKETEHLAPVFIRPIAEALKMPERSINLAIRDAMKG